MTQNDSGVADLIAKAEGLFGLIVTARTARRLVAASPAAFNRAIRTGALPMFGRRGRRGARLFAVADLILWAANGAKARH